jgi:hypothetical protein
MISRGAAAVPLVFIVQGTEELRPALVLHNVNGANFFNVDAQLSKGASLFQLQSVVDFSASHCKGVKDTKLERVERGKF